MVSFVLGNVLGLVDRDGRKCGELFGDLEHELARAGVRRGGQGEEGIAERLDMRAQLFEQALVLHDVGLVRDDDLRAGGKVGGILRELCVDGIKVLDRVAALAA